MACFIVPGTEAIVTTAITKIVEKKEKKEICSCETEGTVEAVKEEKVLPFSRKLRWLNNMLWGGTALLAFEHVWHLSLIHILFNEHMETVAFDYVEE